MEVPSKERQCQKLAQSSDLVVGLHGGLGEMSHSLGSQHGCYGFYPTRKHLGALGKGLEPQHTASCAAYLASLLADISSVP